MANYMCKGSSQTKDKGDIIPPFKFSYACYLKILLSEVEIIIIVTIIIVVKFICCPSRGLRWLRRNLSRLASLCLFIASLS